MKKSILFSVLVLITLISNSQSLNGNYTINQNLPTGNGNYQSFSSLAADLNAFGVSGPVDVNVAPGTYQGSLYLKSIQGTSSTNTVTIDGQDSSLSILEHEVPYTSWNEDATVVLDSVQYVTIKNLTIKNMDSTSGVGLLFKNTCKFNVVSNCVIEVNPSHKPVTAMHGPFVNIFYKNSSDTSIHSGYNRISNNKISGGWYGISMYANTTFGINVIQGNKITSNEFYNISQTGIDCSYQDLLEISDNKLQVFNSGGTAININFSSNISIIGNSTKSDRGLFLSDLTEKVELVNNMIMNGLILTRIDSAVIYHNSIFGSSIFGAALNIQLYGTASVVDGFDIRNNIFSSKDGQAVETTVGDSIFLNMDHNIYHSGGPLLFTIGKSYFQDLASYQMVSSQFNASSMEMDPNFLSDTSNLHLLKSHAFDKGDGSLGIMQDIDGDPRPFPGSHGVDIGADEFMPIGPNAQAVSWQSNPFCAGTAQPTVKVANLGADTIHSLWLVYSLNGTKDSVYSTSGIPPSEDLDIALNPYNFIADSIYQLLAYTQMPNGMSDAVPLDDTLQLEIRTGLSGTYSIDSAQVTASTNFQSFEDLATVLNQDGLCGPTTVNIVSGSGPYNNQVWLESIPNMNANNTLTINGNGEKIQHRSTGPEDERAVFNFRNISYLTLDSLDIYLDNAGYGYGAGVHIMNGCHHININNCSIKLDSAVSNYVYERPTGISILSLFRTNDIPQSGNAYALTITNNKINGADYGISFIYRPESYINSLEYSKNNVISNNKIEIYIVGILALFHDSLLIESNDISQDSSFLYNSITGIRWSASNSLINKNIVHDLLKKRSGSTAILGGTDSTMGRSFVTNNLVYNIFNDENTTGISGTGSYYYNNTISLDDSVPTANRRVAAGISAGLGATFMNNLISISKGGAGVKTGISYAPSIPFTSDYNNIFLNSPGTGPEYYGSYRSGSSIIGFSTLASWQSNSGQDMNSFNVDPQFVNPAMGDFTPQNLALDGSGMAFPQVTEDLYGNPRGNNPDIGAIEFGNPVGIMERDGSTIMLFPNPSAGKFTLVVTPNNKEKFSLSLWDMNGKEMFSKEMTISRSRLESLDFSSFPKGMYLLKIQTEDEMKTEKLIIH